MPSQKGGVKWRCEGRCEVVRCGVVRWWGEGGGVGQVDVLALVRSWEDAAMTSADDHRADDHRAGGHVARDLVASDDVAAAAEVLRAGGLVAFPTETVYGLGADATNEEALRKVFAAKGRPATHPLIVHLGTQPRLEDWAVDVPDAAHRLAEAFWPGPLTVLLRRGERISPVATGGRDTVGLRVPAHEVALELLYRFGGPVAAPSANRFGEVSPTTAQHVLADLGPSVDLVLEGGASVVGVESTIVDLTGAVPTVLRPGGVSVADLEAVLGRSVAVWTADAEAAVDGVVAAGEEVAPAREGTAPGTLSAHYSPVARVVLVPATVVAGRAEELVAGDTRVGVLAPIAIDDLPTAVIELEPVGGADRYAHLLYQRLRQADRLGVEVLLVVPPDATDGIGLAVLDRLRRAAAADEPATDQGT